MIATRPDLGSDGRLLETNVVSRPGPDNLSHNDIPDDQCKATFGSSDAATTPNKNPGTYYWQVWRYCAGCATGFETSPVWRITVTRAAPNATLRVTAPARVFAGFGAMATVTATGVLDNEIATIQASRPGGAWRTAGSGMVRTGSTRAVVVLRRGESLLRAVVGDPAGGQVVSPNRSVTVAVATRWPAAATWRGAWVGRTAGTTSNTVKFRISADGRRLTGGSFEVTMLCPTPAGITPFTIQHGYALVPSARVAPDGTIVGAFNRSNTTVLLEMRLRGRTATGRAKLSVGSCTGAQSFTARRR